MTVVIKITDEIENGMGIIMFEVDTVKFAVIFVAFVAFVSFVVLVVLLGIIMQTPELGIISGGH
jgi:hypothetical protein